LPSLRERRGSHGIEHWGSGEVNGKLNEMALHKPLNAIKNLGAAFRNFFEGRG
jgi:hypothetical protein